MLDLIENAHVALGVPNGNDRGNCDESVRAWART